MGNDIVISNLHTVFEAIKKSNELKQEFWSARELAKTLGYSEYRHFIPVIDRAKEACLSSGQILNDHFEDVLEMIELGKTASRQVENIHLSRYAGYLIMQNADPSKKIVALGQTYFAVQTRKQEIFNQLAEGEKRVYIRGQVVEQNKKLFGTARTAGVSHFGSFNDAGYRGLYGRSLSEIEKYKGIKKGELLDRAGSAELAANLFRITQTDEKLKKDNIKGEREASNTHFMVGGKVRQTIKDIGGALPENLPTEKHIKEIVRELKKLGVVENIQVVTDGEESKQLLQELISPSDVINAEVLSIEIPANSTASDLKIINKYLKDNPGDTPVAIYLSSANIFKKLNLNFGVKVSQRLIEQIESVECIVFLHDLN